MGALETDYLVIGAGAAGMAVTDSLVSHSDADVIVVDRRHRPGGHWNDAYPFVRLHQPSAYYGVNSRVLGSDSIDLHGTNADAYERASGAEVCDYFGRVLDEQLLPSGRVRFFGMHDYRSSKAPGEHRLVSRLTGDVIEVKVRRKLVDATYLETPVPATHAPSFQVDPAVRVVPVNGLVNVTEPYSSYVLIGAGKTAMDACLWLLDNGVEPARIRWIRPRDAWLLDRAGWQPLELVASIMEGLSLELEALAAAESVDDLFARLESCGRMLRLDDQVSPTMFHGAIVSQAEVAALRRVHDVIRLGRVLRIEADRIAFEHGSVPTDPSQLHIDCSAAGLRIAPVRPIFEAGRITIQQVRTGSPTFNAALIGYVEATRKDASEQNRLCPPQPYGDAAHDWLRGVLHTQLAAQSWFAEPDLAAWLEGSRLNLLRGALDRAGEPRMHKAFERYAKNVKPGMTRLRQLLEG